jgi:ABC-type lipoprotein release transport system permease subunit
MARALWPGQEALGQCFRVRADTVPCTTVIGVAEDMVQRELDDARRFHFYMPIDQFRRTHGNGLVMRLRGDPSLEAESIRAALQRVMPGSAYVVTQPLLRVVYGAQRAWRLGATMFVAFGALAVVVAAVGLHGVIGYNVAQRMHELGVRVALGAQRRAILALVVGHGLRLVLVGIAIGTLAGLAASRWIEPLLFRQSARDPLVFGGVGGVMIGVALVASALPALRAAKADPNSALRAE